jgi:hypothetical protein
MSSSTAETQTPTATGVGVSVTMLTVGLADGRTIAAPLAWFPRLSHATPAERSRWRLVAGGRGIHWPDLDEDVSLDGLLAGKRSMESQASFKPWLAARSKRPRPAQGAAPRTR